MRKRLDLFGTACGLGLLHGFTNQILFNVRHVKVVNFCWSLCQPWVCGHVCHSPGCSLRVERPSRQTLPGEWLFWFRWDMSTLPIGSASIGVPSLALDFALDFLRRRSLASVTLLAGFLSWLTANGLRRDFFWFGSRHDETSNDNQQEVLQEDQQGAIKGNAGSFRASCEGEHLECNPCGNLARCG
jgi:hypothetical protein